MHRAGYIDGNEEEGFMDVRNCKDCGRLFNYVSGPRLCGACRQKLEEKFGEVKEYIRDNPSASISQISEEMNVSTQQIRQWIREERLIFSEDSVVTIDCEKCGAQIRTGRYCEKCKSQMAHNLDSLYKKEQPVIQKTIRDRDRMRYLDKQQ